NCEASVPCSVVAARAPRPRPGSPGEAACRPARAERTAQPGTDAASRESRGRFFFCGAAAMGGAPAGRGHACARGPRKDGRALSATAVVHIRVRLPDGSTLEVPRGSKPQEVAERIGPRLARAALAARADGQIVDMSRPLEHDVRLEIITEKSPEALDLLRHS